MTKKTTPVSCGNSFDSFTAAVRESVEKHAQRKGYRTTHIDGENNLADFMNSIPLNGVTLGQAHAAAEIIYKCVEFLKDPRRVPLEKVAGWALMAWKETPPDKP